MTELVQVVGAVALVPLMVLSVLAWGQALFGSSGPDSRRAGRQGAVLWTAASLAVAAVVLGGWVVPRPLAAGLLAAGLVAGAIVATLVLRKPQQQ